jgi:tRNA-binding EMAP/Myf-like protein
MSSGGVVVAEVLRVRRHSNADLIRLADIDIGDGWSRQIVFGGDYTPRPGQLVAAAPPGSRLCTGVKIRRRHYRGEWSNGMLCSTTELGWEADGPDEVAILRPGIAPGTSLDDVVVPDDWLAEPWWLDEANFRPIVLGAELVLDLPISAIPDWSSAQLAGAALTS